VEFVNVCQRIYERNILLLLLYMELLSCDVVACFVEIQSSCRLSTAQRVFSVVSSSSRFSVSCRSRPESPSNTSPPTVCIIDAAMRIDKK